MPPRARPTRSTASGRAPTAKSLSSSARQSSLTFNNNKNNNRVTKPAVAPSTKDKKAEGKAAKLLLQQSEDQPSPRVSAEEIRPDNDEIEEGGKREEVNTAQIPLRIQLPQQAQQTKQKIPSSGPEATAQKITKSQIKKYWTTKESERKTPRVHQSGLSLHERILREFDMSYQYGPCIGISRTRRWMRAHNLGLGPAIEVLAVLLLEEESAGRDGEGKKDRVVERAYMDTLVNSRLVGVA